jgi:homoserine O-acetyltransferase/O-succinyltransferase
MSLQRCLLPTPFPLDCGELLYDAELAFDTRGALNAERSNAVLYIHALSGNASLEGTSVDISKYFVISPNVLGSCYGSTGPETIDDRTDRPYRTDFPKLTIRDIARSVIALLDELNIESLSFAIGGSFGAMVILELAMIAPDRVKRLVVLSCGAEHSAWRIAFSSVIRKTVEYAIKYKENVEHAFSMARQIAMISYRSAEEFDARFGRLKRDEDLFEVESYLEHQGVKIVERFSPHSYITLTRAMEGYSLFEGREGSRKEILSTLSMPVLVVGTTSDVLYPEAELKAFASELPKGRYESLDAPYGHDSFLVAEDNVSQIIYQFLNATEYEHEYNYA